MGRKTFQCLVGVWLAASSFLDAGRTLGADLGTAFSYQGYLENPPGTPVDDTCDLRFRLWKDATSVMTADQVGSTLTFDGLNAVDVFNGVFSVGLDFGAGAMDGTARWLAVDVCCPSSCTMQPLNPRVELTPAPYALGLHLPLDQTHAVTTVLSTPAFGITNTADGGYAARFSNTDATNRDPALYATAPTTNGEGPALRILGARTSDSPGTAGGNVGAVWITDNPLSSRGDGMYLDGDGIDVHGDLNLQENTGNDVILVEGGGKVGIGTNAPAMSLDVNGVAFFEGNSLYLRNQTAAATTQTWGMVVSTSDGKLNIGDAVDVPSGGVLSNTRMVIERNGNVGLGTISPDVKLHVEGGTDTAPGGGGYIVTGSPTGLNISIDNNEIMARNNGAVATLALNANGGDVAFGGAIDIGYEIVSASDSDGIAEVSCSAGRKVIGGGCSCVPDGVELSRPVLDNVWSCICDSNSATLTVQAICARVK